MKNVSIGFALPFVGLVAFCTAGCGGGDNSSNAKLVDTNGSASSAGTTANTGGSSNVVSSSNTGGTSVVSGGATSVDTSSSMGGITSALGGNTATGGNSSSKNVGGTKATGGAKATVGGSSSIGGGTSAAGGAATTGGSQGTGGTTTVSPIDRSIVPADRRIEWNPGILADDLMQLPLTADRIPTRTTICGTADATKYANGTTDATAHIQGLLDKCPSGQVVSVPQGNWRLTKGQQLFVPSGVVLRGAGAGKTFILRDPTSTSPDAAVIGGNTDTWSTNYKSYNVSGNISRGAKQITLASGGGDFHVGEIVLLDQVDDHAYIPDETGVGIGFSDSYGSRTANNPWRTLTTLCEITVVNGNVLTLKDGVTHDFVTAQSPQVSRLLDGSGTFFPYAKWVGIENMTVSGSRGRGGNVGLRYAAYSWIKGVESNGSFVTGSTTNLGATFGLVLDQCYRCVIRDSYAHDSLNYADSSDSYGIVLIDNTTNSLVENNIAIYMDKPIQFQTTGGGNVIGYNYVDGAFDMNPTGQWMEQGIDFHLQFPHHELIEGNYANQIGPAHTHGGAGWITLFRNWATSVVRTPIGAVGDNAPSSSLVVNQNTNAVFFGSEGYYGTTIGNVLLVPGSTLNTKQYEYSLDYPNAGDGNVAYTLADSSNDKMTKSTFHRHLDFDYATNKVYDNPNNTVKTLPDSLYLTGKPAFMGSNPWPWVNPAGTSDADRIKTLPAKARYDAGNPNGT